MKQFDCVVVGAGMVGAATALSLASLGLSVAIVDKNQPQAFSPEQPYDLRVSAISLASEHLLRQLGAWSYLQQWRKCPYQRLAVSEQDYAYTEFNAEDIKQDHLGHIIENRLIQLALWSAIAEQPAVTLFCPETVNTIEQHADHALVTLANTVIKTKLVVGADGANSQVRALANIGTTGWDYPQSAMIINVKTALAQQNITWQQYFPTGPVAMLPLAGQYASLVWYHQKDDIKRLMALNAEQLQQEIVNHFPKKLGDITVLDKAAFDLTRRHANQYVKGNIVLLGDAAHTINPMAGQGVNLGFKDVKALQHVIAEAIADNKPCFSVQTLSLYEKKRRTDNLLMMSTMDGLFVSFSHPSKLVKLARNAGLFAINKLPLIKNKALAYACGVTNQ